ncbi:MULTISPECIES: hypothetical protein [unclassified Coleofasciculus]|uniref:hypothetical protein n=1 Tax=unclassified Coleofasciculus TaxID=2692782 RepID=UPI00187E23C6|nr:MULTISPECIES: hypothetical protein [unclassified Coleofasciculus]MBE9128853.1 hypothetical protein [Coleofasciculus sp. LEGE 07081]MBE9151523.1 hypothetical protein [Coleofasciculus sp. LEGE 07092]
MPRKPSPPTPLPKGEGLGVRALADFVPDVADRLLVSSKALPLTDHLSVTSVTPSAATDWQIVIYL